MDTDGDLCKTLPFAQSLRCVHILILEIFDIFLWLKSSRALILDEIEHFSKVSDDLTEMAYESIIIANEITDFLKCDLGIRCKDYKDENAYLNGILKFIRKIKNNPEGYLDYWNLWEELDPGVFAKGIEGLEKHIKKTIETPIEQRGELD